MLCSSFPEAFRLSFKTNLKKPLSRRKTRQGSLLNACILGSDARIRNGGVSIGGGWRKLTVRGSKPETAANAGKKLWSRR